MQCLIFVYCQIALTLPSPTPLCSWTPTRNLFSSQKSARKSGHDVQTQASKVPQKFWIGDNPRPPWEMSKSKQNKCLKLFVFGFKTQIPPTPLDTVQIWQKFFPDSYDSPNLRNYFFKQLYGQFISFFHKSEAALPKPFFFFKKKGFSTINSRMSRNMYILRHKLCNVKTGVGPTFTWSNEAWFNYFAIPSYKKVKQIFFI